MPAISTYFSGCVVLLFHQLYLQGRCESLPIIFGLFPTLFLWLLWQEILVLSCELGVHRRFCDLGNSFSHILLLFVSFERWQFRTSFPTFPIGLPIYCTMAHVWLEINQEWGRNLNLTCETCVLPVNLKA